MPIVLPCPQCGHKYELADALAGKRVRCKHCARVFTVPVPSRPPSTTNLRRRPAAEAGDSGSRRPQPGVEPPPVDPSLLFDLDPEPPQVDPDTAALKRAAGFEHLADEDDRP